ncbi:MAG: nucleotidyltransferase domain-containing protein, partial [Anaerolineae bacterium]|nr:nucleotidyltransferase domain-containing protein [Anaerolineae bacterium]
MHDLPTTYPDVNAVLDALLTSMRRILGDRLIGLYLYGSLVWGDFDPDTSDIDMLAALASDLDDAEFAAVQAMHARVAAEHPRWNDRIEVQYHSAEGLRTFKAKASPMANISPGEPFHRITAGRDWLMNW